MSSIKIGIYGTGVAADNHAYAIAKNTKYSLIAVSDNHISLSKDFARRHHVDRYYGDLEYLLSDRDVDIVTVTSPFTDNSFLLPYIAETGRSVIMETPLAPNLDEAERIIKISEDEGIFLLNEIQSYGFNVGVCYDNIYDMIVLVDRFHLKGF